MVELPWHCQVPEQVVEPTVMEQGVPTGTSVLQPFAAPHIPGG